MNKKRIILLTLAGFLILSSLSELEPGELPVDVVLSEIGDDSRILFVGSLRNSPDEIYSVNADGTDIQQHTSGCINVSPETYCRDYAPSVSPDGTRLAYERRYFELDELTGIYTVNLDGTEPKFLVAGGRVPTWSPDGKQLAFIRGTADLVSENTRMCTDVCSELFVINADGTGRRRITDLNGGHFPIIPDRSSLNEGGGYVFETTDSLSWSPDGKQIVFDAGLYGNIYTVNVDGGLNSGLTPLLDADDKRFSRVSWAFGNNRFTAESPSWSPDGKRIAFDVRRGSDRMVYTINPDGTDAIHVADGHYPTWSPDSQYLLFWNGYNSPKIGSYVEDRNWFYRKADGSPEVGAITRSYYTTRGEGYISPHPHEDFFDPIGNLANLNYRNADISSRSRSVWYQPASVNGSNSN